MKFHKKKYRKKNEAGNMKKIKQNIYNTRSNYSYERNNWRKGTDKQKNEEKKQEARQTSSNSLVYEDDVGELPAKIWLHNAHVYSLTQIFVMYSISINRNDITET